MSTLSPQRRIANTAAVCDGPYGAVTQQAQRAGVSRQALYRDAPKVLQAVEGAATQRQLQELQDEIDRLRAEGTALRRQLQQAVLVEDDTLAHYASTAQAEGVSLPVARRLLGPLLATSLAPTPRAGPACPASPGSAAWHTPPRSARPRCCACSTAVAETGSGKLPLMRSSSAASPA